MKVGIMSSSRIVAEFLKHVGEMRSVEVTAMCVRPQSAERAREMLNRAGLPGAKLYTDEAAFLTDGDFDFVYNGTANHLHFEQAERALRAGRNVILEKPLTVRLSETQALFDLAEQSGLWLWEAITTPYVPGYDFLRRMLPEIGPVRAVTVNFSKYSTRYDDYLAGRWNTTFDPACAGGALMDMNVYCLHLVTGLLGAPQSALYLPTVGRNGVDTGGLAALRYPGFQAALVSCKDSSAPASAVIQGERGYLEATSMPNSLERTRAVIGGRVIDGPAHDCFRMAYEFEHFARCWAQNDREACRRAAAQSLTVMSLLDELRRAIPAYAGA